MIVFDQGTWSTSSDWADIHASYLRSIASVDHPNTPGKLTLRKRHKGADGKYVRNGVGYLHERFVEHLVTVEKWNAQEKVVLAPDLKQPPLHDYPTLTPYSEPVTSSFGAFDVLLTTKKKTRVAIEWETGNISSSHRSLNKLTMCLTAKNIDIGVLIVPSRELYTHLTDRIGNIGELSPYLEFWERARATVPTGMLVITVVEHDDLSDDTAIAPLKVGMDGNARQAASKVRIAQAKTLKKAAAAQTPKRRRTTRVV